MLKISYIRPVAIPIVPLWNWVIAWSPVLLLAAFLRTAHPMYFTLDTDCVGSSKH